MRWILVALLATAGCDRVFGLDVRDAAPLDASSDAELATIVSLELAPALIVGETSPVTARVEGTPGTLVTCTFSAVRGAIVGGDVMVTLDSTGAAEPTVVYTAPATAGDETIRASVGASAMSKTVPVRQPTTVGNDSTLGGGLSVYGPGVLFGTRLVLTSSFTATQIGAWTNIVMAGTRARLGIYDVNRNLLVETGPVSAALGRNVYSLAAPRLLAAGTYWIVTVYEQQVAIYSEPATAGENYTAGSAVSIDAPMPAVLPFGSSPGLRYAQFLVGSN